MVPPVIDLAERQHNIFRVSQFSKTTFLTVGPALTRLVKNVFSAADGTVPVTEASSYLNSEPSVEIVAAVPAVPGGVYANAGANESDI